MCVRLLCIVKVLLYFVQLIFTVKGHFLHSALSSVLEMWYHFARIGKDDPFWIDSETKHFLYLLLHLIKITQSPAVDSWRCFSGSIEFARSIPVEQQFNAFISIFKDRWSLVIGNWDTSCKFNKTTSSWTHPFPYCLSTRKPTQSSSMHCRCFWSTTPLMNISSCVHQTYSGQVLSDQHLYWMTAVVAHKYILLSNFFTHLACTVESCP